MIGFLGDTPILENRITGCHGNYAFSHITSNRFIFWEHFFTSRGVPGNNYGTHEKLAFGMQGRLN